MRVIIFDLKKWKSFSYRLSKKLSEKIREDPKILLDNAEDMEHIIRIFLDKIIKEFEKDDE